MKELVIATKNKGKLREIKELLADLNIKVTSLANYPSAPVIIEDGRTYRENAVKKAETIARFTKKLTLGEDSGIEIKALSNRPGIHSARFSGPNATDKKNNAKLLRLLKGFSKHKRTARYRCFAALVDKNGLVGVLSGTCGGLITDKARGKNGFGYDPYFFIKRYGKTFGELDPLIKAKISHRARAFKKVREVLKRYLKTRL